MRKIILALSLLMLLGGGAGEPHVSRAAEPGEPFTGEVWTWDARAGTVTLRQLDRTVRILVTPEQLAGLRRGEVVTIRGRLAPPAEIEHRVEPALPLAGTPIGPFVQSEATGEVRSIDGEGILTIDASQGRLRVWVATPVGARFVVGGRVRIVASVQRMAPGPADRPGAAAAPALPAAASGELGDHAVVIGRILDIDASGRLTVESPRGPITVWVAERSALRAGDPVQVQTRVHRLD
jgi:hypothetical protein